MERVYYDIADNFVKDLEKKLNKSIEINDTYKNELNLIELEPVIKLLNRE